MQNLALGGFQVRSHSIRGLPQKELAFTLQDCDTYLSLYIVRMNGKLLAILEVEIEYLKIW